MIMEVECGCVSSWWVDGCLPTGGACELFAITNVCCFSTLFVACVVLFAFMKKNKVGNANPRTVCLVFVAACTIAKIVLSVMIFEEVQSAFWMDFTMFIGLFAGGG